MTDSEKAVETILFVCVENACRSQIAEAYARMLGGDNIRCWSAGSRPSGIVNPAAIESMQAEGYDLSAHKSISLSDVPRIEFDYVVTMGCDDECRGISARKRIEWEIPDPKDMDPEEFGEVRDQIRGRVDGLLGAS